MKHENKQPSAVDQAMHAAMYTRPAAEKAKGSTAEVFNISAKGVEPDLRREFYARMEPADCRARAAGKVDIVLYIDGHRYNGEVKTGGTVGKPACDGTFSEAEILPRAQYVVFVVIDRCDSWNDVLDNTAIMPREQFLELCEASSRKGLHGTFHITSPGKKGRAPVVAFQPTPLEKLRRQVEALIESGEVMTAWDYLEQRKPLR